MCLGVLFIRIYLFFSVHLVNIKGGECSNVKRNDSQNLSESNTKSIHRTKYRDTRFVWNQMLNMWNTRYQNNPNLPTLKKYTLNNLLPTLKIEYPLEDFIIKLAT